MVECYNGSSRSVMGETWVTLICPRTGTGGGLVDAIMYLGGSIKWAEFLDELRNCQLLKKGCAAWRQVWSQFIEVLKTHCLDNDVARNFPLEYQVSWLQAGFENLLCPVMQLYRFTHPRTIIIFYNNLNLV